MLEKQLGPVVDYPEDPNAPKPFVVQAHFRGKSVHLDFRFARNGFAEGWTVSAQVESAIKVPVVTISQAEKICRSQEYWKFDLETGYIFPREVKTTVRGEKRTVIRPGALYAERKAQLLPKEWLEVEGRTGWPPDWPKTILEFWDEWPEEVRRELKREGFDKETAKRLLETGEWKVTEIPVGATRAFPGVLLVMDKGMWVPGARKPYFFEYFLEDNKLFPERLMFRLVARAKSLKEAVVLSKNGAIVLPPGKEDEAAREPGYWLFYTPDPTPYVLSEEALEKEWLPPPGVAALPSSLQKQVPQELRFWEEKDEEKRMEMREALALWYQEGLSHEEKAEAPKFRLFRQTFRGPVVIRFGPSTLLYYLLVNAPKMVFALDNDPRLRKEVAGFELSDEFYAELWSKKSFEPEPSSLLNPTKETPSKIELIDEGNATVMEEGPGFLKLKLEGREITGYYVVLWESEDSPLVVVRRTEEPSAEASTKFSLVGKSDEKQIVYGVVLSPHGPDAQGDIISPEEIEEAAHRFLIFGREIGLNHKGDPINAFVVESFVAPETFRYVPDKPETEVKKGEWVLAVWIPERKIWEEIKEGKLTGWSIQGLGIRRRVEENGA